MILRTTYVTVIATHMKSGVTTAKYQTISIEIVGTCMIECLAYIFTRHTALYFSVKEV